MSHWTKSPGWADRRGSIAIVAAITLTALLCAAAMALDLANLYLTQSIDQRIADQSALAAAIAYGQSGNSLATAKAAASSLAAANGAGSSTVTTTMGTAPANPSETAAKVVVTSSVALSSFGKMIYGGSNVSVSATAYAAIQQTAPCLLGTASGSSGGMTTTGGASVTATGCNIGTNGGVSVQGGQVTAQSIYAVGTIATSGGGTITTTGGKHSGASAQSDPYAGSNVFARIATVAALAAPSFPSSTVGSAPSGSIAKTCSGSTMTVGSGNWGTVSASAACTITFTGGAETDIGSGGITLSGSHTITLNFAAGTYKINGIYLGGSATVVMNISGAVVFEIWSGINLQSGTTPKLTVNGPATYYVQGGISSYSTKSLTFTNGSGSSTSTFVVTGGITISSGTAAFPNGTYTILGPASDGIAIGSNASATFGNGSFVITGIYGGISLASSATLTIGSELSSSSLFEITGVGSGYDAIGTGGSSSLTIGSFTNVDLNGAVSVASSLSFGAATVTINGAFSACGSGGGTITGTSVSIVTAGAICFGQGFSSINFTAPATLDQSSEGSPATVALASQSSSTAEISAGATNTVVVGAVYIPNAALTLDGAGTLNGGGGCLQIVAGRMSWSAGSSTSTDCSALGGTGSSGSVVLAQ